MCLRTSTANYIVARQWKAQLIAAAACMLSAFIGPAGSRAMG